MNIHELDEVILESDLPEYGLEAGDVGTAVMVHNGGEGFTVEFMTLEGETIAVVTLEKDQVRAAAPNEVSHVRQVTRQA